MGKTPITKAIAESNIDLVKKLLAVISKGDNIYDLPAKDGTTALSTAIGTLNTGTRINI